MKIADRVTNLPPYVFASLEKRLAAMRAKGVDVISLGIGSPDLAPPPFIIDVLHRAASRQDTHGYAGYFGTPALRQAIADYYQRRFGVTVAPDTEVLPLLGSKEGLANMSLAFIDPGDVALVPDPGYPTYRMGALMAGGDAYAVPLLEENDFRIDFSAIPADVVARATVLWLNYPNNPTGAGAPLAFLQEAVDYCREHDLVLCYDNPYCEVTFDGYVAPSVLEVPGAKDVAVEFNSLSKTYNMAGWRIGMAVGNARAIQALSIIKTNVDSGIFVPIQEAATAALNGDQRWLSERNLIYQRRRDIVMEWLPRIGLTARPPKGALYVWAKLPSGVDCEAWATEMFEKAGVWLTPGTAYGECGRGYLRISLCTPEERLAEAGERLSNV
ncbi:MAG TPA: LL-diaminopimelate aminotransferase [Chloroflexi bacterium]|jgi:LL-diaminopimelate aminotransferase|nr:LL-diaminopimelate aminotransferase [Chloroflexota bacterium]